MASQRKPTNKPVNEIMNNVSRVIVKKTPEQDKADGAFDFTARMVMEGRAVPINRP